MEKSILKVFVLALVIAFSVGCGGGGNNNEEDAAVEDSSTEDASDGNVGPTCVTDTTTLPGQATFATNLRFLNQCTTAQYRDFNNTTRIQHPLYVPGGPYPP